MQVLLAVVDAGSISAGSRKLNAPLPSVSRKIAELERHLGTRLLIRTSRNVQLTDAGRDYIEVVRQVVGQINDAELRASGEYQVPRGELRITVPDEFGRRIALPLVYEFLSGHAEITLDIITANHFIDLVKERVDVGIRIGPLADSSLCSVKVGTTSILTCASPEYLARRGRPRTPAELLGHDGVQIGHFARAWIFGSASVPEAEPARRVHANDATDACNAAIWGLGIIRLPNFIVDEHLRSGALVQILEDYQAEPFPIHIMYMKQGLLPLKVRAFVDWIAPRLRKKLHELNAPKLGANPGERVIGLTEGLRSTSAPRGSA
jgi:DNA-binding transcriptional LysR family regulator